MCTAHFAYVHKIFHQLPTTLFMFNRIIVVYIPAIPLYMSTHLRPFISVPNLLQLKSASFIVIHIRHQAILSSLTLPCNSEVPPNSLEASIDCCWSISGGGQVHFFAISPFITWDQGLNPGCYLF